MKLSLNITWFKYTKYVWGEDAFFPTFILHIVLCKISNLLNCELCSVYFVLHLSNMIIYHPVLLFTPSYNMLQYMNILQQSAHLFLTKEHKKTCETG